MLKVHEPGFKIIRDVEKADTETLFEYVLSLSMVLNNVANQLVTGGMVMAERQKEDGQVEVIALPGDYTHPQMLAYIKTAILPTAREVMEHGQHKELGPVMRQLFGSVGCQLILAQDLTPLKRQYVSPQEPPKSAQVLSLANYR